MEKALDGLTLTVPVTISQQRIWDLLCSGMEGGIGYWAQIIRYERPDGEEYDRDADDEFSGKITYPHIDIPFHGGALVLQDIENGGSRYQLDMAALERGLKVMAEKYPRHFSNFMSCNDDAETGDVFVQCAVLGEIVYG